jgi:hypothetical protein
MNWIPNFENIYLFLVHSNEPKPFQSWCFSFCLSLNWHGLWSCYSYSCIYCLFKFQLPWYLWSYSFDHGVFLLSGFGCHVVHGLIFLSLWYYYMLRYELLECFMILFLLSMVFFLKLVAMLFNVLFFLFRVLLSI